MASPTIIHMDMDAFFASVEQLDNPALAGKCLVVGTVHRGVVAAASYEARKYGIHSAMPIFQALQRFPRLVIVPPRRRRYTEISRHIMSILEAFSPLVEPVSIDEAYVDISGCQRLYGSAEETATAMKKRIRAETHLTCSVGIAPNKFLAKIASDLHKPDGLTLIAPHAVDAFIAQLPIEKVPGVGARTQEILLNMGIRQLGQVRRFDERQLTRRLGKFGHRLLDLAYGRDDSPVVPESEAKSISSETTLDKDTTDRNVLATHLLAQSETIARQLRSHEVRARTVTLKLRSADFKRHTRSQTLSKAVQSSDILYRTALDLLRAFSISQPIRLIGLGAGNLQPAAMPVQQDLFGDSPDHQHRRWEQVDRAVDAIAERYGRAAILRGTLAPNKDED